MATLKIKLTNFFAKKVWKCGMATCLHGSTKINK